MTSDPAMEFDIEQEIACFRRDADCCRARARWIEGQSMKKVSGTAPHIFRQMAARCDWVADRLEELNKLKGECHES